MALPNNPGTRTDVLNRHYRQGLDDFSEMPDTYSLLPIHHAMLSGANAVTTYDKASTGLTVTVSVVETFGYGSNQCAPAGFSFYAGPGTLDCSIGLDSFTNISSSAAFYIDWAFTFAGQQDVGGVVFGARYYQTSSAKTIYKFVKGGGETTDLFSTGATIASEPTNLRLRVEYNPTAPGFKAFYELDNAGSYTELGSGDVPSGYAQIVSDNSGSQIGNFLFGRPGSALLPMMMVGTQTTTTSNHTSVRCTDVVLHEG